MSKTGDQLILRPFSQDSPGSDSTGWTPSRKISKVVAPRDTKELFGRAFGLQNSQRARLSFCHNLSFLANSCYPLSFLFLLTISRRPGGMSKQKKSFTLSQLIWWTGRDLNPRPFGHSRQNA